MVFGRKSRKVEEPDEVAPQDPLGEAATQAADAETLDPADSGPQAVEDEAERDEWDDLDASRDWRDDGPFDIDEVDLDADDVQRLDFGTLVITPFDDMQLQLQVEQETRQVQAALAMHGESAIEVALFAAPASESVMGEVRRAMVAATLEGGGQATLTAGPFGAEIRRIVPLTTPEGQQALHVSRTWLVQGPRWMLRGVLMGDAGMQEGLDGPVAQFYDFFRNLVVRRGSAARVPGDLIPMTVPEQLLAGAVQEPAAQAETEL